MILIISSEDDISTSMVIDWFLFLNQKFLRISEKDYLQIRKVDLSNLDEMLFEINDVVYNLNDFKSIWYRRSWLLSEPIDYKGLSDQHLNYAIQKQLYEEKEVLLEFVLTHFRKKSLNSQFDNSLNKLEVLKICKKFEIDTPPTLITTSKKELISFKKQYKDIITKNFSPGVFVGTSNGNIASSTILVDNTMIEELEEIFYPMMFQEMTEKSFEVRAFYLNGQFYSTAIFSQNDEKTKVDFRNYNFEKPNRTPPFSIPEGLKEKLDALMKTLKLNSGSLDLIVTPEGKFVFLEVNPIGQFYQVSFPCNYQIERDVANYLIQA